MKNKYVFSLLLMLSIVSVLNAQDFSQGEQLMLKNKLNDAVVVWKQVPKEDPKYVEALLGIAIVYLENEHIDSALEAFQQFCNVSADPYPYIYALWDKGIFSYSNPNSRAAVRSFMQKLYDNPATPYTLKGMATSFIGGTYLYEHKISTSDNYYNEVGDLKNWSTVGTFDNISSSGFNKSFQALEHPEKSYVFTNNTGAKVQWFDIADARNDRWLDFEYHYDVNNSIIFAQTFIQSDEDKDLKMSLGVSGSVKVWVNDFLIFSEEEERNTDMDAYTIPFKLQKGNNRILVQVGASEINKSNFMIRFVDQNDNLVKNLKSSREFSAYNKAAAYPVKRIPFFAEQYFEKLIASGKASILDQLMMAYVYNHNDKHYEARKINESMKSQAPVSTIISEALIETYSRVNNENAVTREKELVKSTDPNGLYGLILRYWEAMGKEDFEEAQALLSQRKELFGNNEDIEVKQLNLFIQKKDVDKLLKELDYAYTNFRESSTIVGMEYGLQQNVYKDQAKAMKVLKDFLAIRYDENIAETLAGDYDKTGKTKESLDILLKMIKERPFATMRYETIANKYFAAKDYDKALEWEQKTIDQAPYVGKIQLSMASIFDAEGKTNEAIERYRKAVEYNPASYEARKKLRELQGKKDLFSHFKQNDIEQLYKNAPKAEDYPNSNSIYLLKESLDLVYPENGASEERDDYLIKIFNQAGINAWKEVNIPYNSYSQRLIFYKTEILKKDGSKVKAETNENQCVFSTLEVGDAIHISYKLETSTYGRLAAHFWETFTFNSSIPVALSRFALIIPKEKKFQYKAYHFDGAPQITNIDETYQLYEWEQKNNEAIEPEPYMPAYSDITKRVAISSIPDWNYVANWYSDLSYSKVKADFEVKEKVKELLAGKDKLSDFEKAKVIYNYIEENFNYSNTPFLHSALTPQRASRTLNSRLGDCKDLAVLFTSMAREASLDANLVLVDTRDQGDFNVDIPSIDFNHCIAQLKTSEGNYFIELTDNMLPFASMSRDLQYSNALLIPKDGSQTNTAALIKLDSKTTQFNAIVRKTNMTIDNDGNIQMVRTSDRTGAETDVIRANYKNESEEERKKKILKNLTEEFSNKVNLKAVVMTNLDQLKDTVQTKYTFTLEKYTTEIAGMQIIKLPWTDGFTSMEIISPEKRNYPLNIWELSSVNRDIETITIHLPAGKNWVEIPKNESYSCPELSYKITVRQTPDKALEITREMIYLKGQMPVEAYDNFRKTINQIASADKKQIAYK